MKLEGSYTFDAPRDVVWEALFDPEVLKNTMPGCEKLEQTGENAYEAALKVKVGPVQGKFNGNVELTNINKPDSYTMDVSGKGPSGFVKGTGNVTLEDEGDKTTIHYEGEAQVGGRLASVGQRLLDSSAKALTRQSLDGIHKQIKARMEPQEASQAETSTGKNGKNGKTAPKSSSSPSSSKAAAPTVEPPSQMEFAMGVAKNMYEDMVPPEQRPLLAGAGALLLFVLLNWWISGIARRAARKELERRY